MDPMRKLRPQGSSDLGDLESNHIMTKPPIAIAARFLFAVIRMRVLNFILQARLKLTGRAVFDHPAKIRQLLPELFA